MASLLWLTFLTFGMTAQIAWGMDSDTNAAINPIRKVVTMLQAMQQKVTAEGKKEEELYDKFMCYCQHGNDDLSLSISDANNKVPQLGTDIKASQEKRLQAEQDLEQAQTDRSAAKAAMNEAEALREKEAAAFAVEKAELDANIAAIDKAVTALERGMSGGFLQTVSAKVLRKMTMSGRDMSDGNRQVLLAFLSGTEHSEYSPQSGEVTGILKEIGDSMKQNLADATAQENTSIKNFEELMAAKKKEVDALTEAIETKSFQIGELGMSIARMKNDLSDSEAALIADQKMQAELKQSCETKTGEWEERKKLRAEELVALAETIKVLNDDDALDLFKQTLPGASASLLQVHAGFLGAQEEALSKIHKALAVVGSHPSRVHLDFVALALHGKKVGFEKVIKMVDNMIVTLKAEQGEDDNKQEYCTKQLDGAEDKKKVLSQKVDDAETAIEEAKERLSTLKEELKSLEAGIKALDKSMAEATEMRQAQHRESTELITQNTAAKELLDWAMNRLHKFYNPRLHKAPPKPELELGQVNAVDALGGAMTVLAQVSTHVVRRDEAAPPPGTWSQGYTKKSEESSGVLAMINLLVADLEKEIVEAETEEKNAQKDYEATVADATAKRAADTTSVIEKKTALADTEMALEVQSEGKKNTGRELLATAAYISQLHGECDWLVQYYEVRKEARASEVEALQNAKAVLHGADFSFVQQTPPHPAGFLRRSR